MPKRKQKVNDISLSDFFSEEKEEIVSKPTKSKMKKPSYYQKEFWVELKKRLNDFMKSEEHQYSYYYTPIKGYVYGLAKINPESKVSQELVELYNELKRVNDNKKFREDSELLNFVNSL